MAIPLTRYVDITSGVGAASSVAQRDLIGRLFTTNPLVPPDGIVQFIDLEEVGAYFGTDSDEYSRAEFYFGWISKNITAAQKISFARWVDEAVAATIYGKAASYSLGGFTPVTSGSLKLTLGGFTHEIDGINLSGAGSLAAVATDVQTAIRAYTAGGADWTAAAVSFDAVRGSFDFTGGVVGTEILAVLAAGTGTDLAPLLGWTNGAIVGQGSPIVSITDTLQGSADQSNNFGSFLFMDILTQDQIVEAATWNQAQNIMFMYDVPVTAANAAAIAAAVADIGGVALTLTDPTNYPTEYDEMVPMMILAATDYTRRNSTQNYMFQIFDLTAKVTASLDADTYDALKVNYYGQTQSAGQLINFYQRGVLTGLPVSPSDQNVYANEQWLKDAASAAVMTLLLALAKVSADNAGKSQILGVLQNVVNLGLFNGTISVGKPLTTVQQLYITNATNDPLAWKQVQNLGYWLDVVIQPVTEDGVVKYIATYTLIYSKDDIIRKVVGTHVLI